MDKGSLLAHPGLEWRIFRMSHQGAVKHCVLLRPSVAARHIRQLTDKLILSLRKYRNFVIWRKVFVNQNHSTDCNQTPTNFLDLTFDLTNGTYKPYRKPNDQPLYINSSSNHPPSIKRELPKSNNKRINELSSNKDIFDVVAPLKYEPANTNTCTKCNRQRNILWFNPPFSKNVKTNIARDFLKFIDKHFPPNNNHAKLFNIHNARVSYSRNENMETINRHNKAVLNRHNKRAKINVPKTAIVDSRTYAQLTGVA